MLNERHELLSSAEMAAGVLEAWRLGGWSRLSTQLERVSARCQVAHCPDSAESERLELLEGVVEFLRTDLSAERFHARQIPVRAIAGLRLLRHLASHVSSRGASPRRLEIVPPRSRDARLRPRFSRGPSACH